jgi:hypothetical protein
LIRLLVPALAAVAVIGSPYLYGQMTAESRITPALQHELGDGSYAYSVLVDMNFQPEAFHIQQLQAIGTVAGVTGHRVRVLQLTADQVREIASFYWVSRVEPLDTAPSAPAP